MKNKKALILIFTIVIVSIALYGVYRYDMMELLSIKIIPEEEKLEVWIYMNDNDSGYYFKMMNNFVFESDRIFTNREYKPGDDEFIDIIRDRESITLSEENFQNVVNLADTVETSIESVENSDIASTYCGGMIIAVKYKGKYYDISAYTEADWSNGDDESRQILLKELYELMFTSTSIKPTHEDIDNGFYIPNE